MMPGFEYWEMLEPMKYFDKQPDGLSENLKKKYDAMISNENNEYIATCKYDGEWTMFIKWDGRILIRSRSISKVTGKYGDKTAHLPHLVEEMQYWPDNTVILGEVCWGDFGSVSTDVGTILRCLPAKAVERQKERKLVVKVFDCLAILGDSLLTIPYADRIAQAHNMISLTHINGNGYFTMTNICPSDKTPAEFADEIISQGGEGAVIQRKDYVYEPGKRTAWKTLKLKQRLPQMELKVVGRLSPKQYYEGDCPETWPYYVMVDDTYDDEEGNTYYTSQKVLVTKPYFYGWMNGIVVELPDGTTCEVTSGLTDADREWLATMEAAEMIKNNELYAVIQAMQINTLGRLRHPALVRLRNDM
jgi:ATP-dependent DNA ligase